MRDDLQLTEREEQLLKKYGGFYHRLETGQEAPTTEAQEHFVAMCRGETKAETEHEVAYAKYMAFRASDRLGPKRGSIPENEEGLPTAAWFTDEDWSKLHHGRR